MQGKLLLPVNPSGEYEMVANEGDALHGAMMELYNNPDTGARVDVVAVGDSDVAVPLPRWCRQPGRLTLPIGVVMFQSDVQGAAPEWVVEEQAGYVDDRRDIDSSAKNSNQSLLEAQIVELQRELASAPSRENCDAMKSDLASSGTMKGSDLLATKHNGPVEPAESNSTHETTAVDDYTEDTPMLESGAQDHVREQEEEDQIVADVGAEKQRKAAAAAEAHRQDVAVREAKAKAKEEEEKEDRKREEDIAAEKHRKKVAQSQPEAKAKVDQDRNRDETIATEAQRQKVATGEADSRSSQAPVDHNPFPMMIRAKDVPADPRELLSGTDIPSMPLEEMGMRYTFVPHLSSITVASEELVMKVSLAKTIAGEKSQESDDEVKGRLIHEQIDPVFRDRVYEYLGFDRAEILPKAKFKLTGIQKTLYIWQGYCLTWVLERIAKGESLSWIALDVGLGKTIIALALMYMSWKMQCEYTSPDHKRWQGPTVEWSGAEPWQDDRANYNLTKLIDGNFPKVRTGQTLLLGNKRIMGHLYTRWID